LPPGQGELATANNGNLHDGCAARAKLFLSAMIAGTYFFGSPAASKWLISQ
jgi:hypothetical protein